VGRHAREKNGTKSIKLIHAAHAKAAQAIEQHIAPGYEAVRGTKHNIAWENSKVITTNNRYVPGHFLRIRPWRGGEASTKRNYTILSVERCQMVIGNKKFGVVSYLIVEGIGIFSL
jgi:ferredoxin-NADP reductase